MNGTPTMKTMLKDMFEFLDSLADILDIEHDESLEKLKKKSNNQFLQFNIFMMMTVVKTLLEDKADTPCNHCHQELKEENHELLEEKKSWQEGEFKLTKLLAEERAKNVELQKELKRSQELFNAQPLVKQIEKLKIKLQNREEMMKDRIDERDTFEKSLCKAEQEVKKQKEVVKQLQKFQADENDAKDIRCVNKIAEEVEKNRKLTKENKYLKEEIERLNSS